MGTVEHDTMAYHSRLADETKIAENCTEEVEKYSDKDLIEYICDYQSVENDFVDFIIADLQNIWAEGNPYYLLTKTGGIPDLLLDLLQKENYGTYFAHLTDEKKAMVREIVINHRIAKTLEDIEEFGS